MESEPLSTEKAPDQKENMTPGKNKMAQKTMSEKEFKEHIKRREGDFEFGLDYFLEKNGKRVWPDDKSYDKYTSTSKNVGILRYANGKMAGHTDDEDILYVLAE